jgi:hypothetical protein
MVFGLRQVLGGTAGKLFFPPERLQRLAARRVPKGVAAAKLAAARL